MRKTKYLICVKKWIICIYILLNNKYKSKKHVINIYEKYIKNINKKYIKLKICTASYSNFVSSESNDFASKTIIFDWQIKSIEIILILEHFSFFGKSDETFIAKSLKSLKFRAIGLMLAYGINDRRWKAHSVRIIRNANYSSQRTVSSTDIVVRIVIIYRRRRLPCRRRV